MGRSAGLFDWRVTRLLFATAGVAAGAATGIGLVHGPSAKVAWLLIAVGIALVVVSTGGPSDGDAAWRNRSVLSVRVRRPASRIASLPFTPRMPRGVSPPRK